MESASPRRPRRQKNASTPWCLRRAPLPVHRCYRRHSQLCGDHSEQPIHLHDVRNASCTTEPSAFGTDNAVRVQIINNEVLIVPPPENARMHPSGWSTLRHVAANLRDAVAMVQTFPNVEFVMCLVDTHAKWPVLINGHEQRDEEIVVRGTHRRPPPRPFLIPIAMRAASMNRGVPATAPTPLDHAAWPAAGEWQRRKAVAMWRGSNTGTPLLRLSTWAANTRGRLTALSRLFPRQLDAAISGWPQPHGGAKEQAALNRVVRSSAPMPFASLSGYRYLIDVDGNVQSNRFPALLRMGSLVLKSTRYHTALSAAVAAGQFPQVVDIEPSLGDLIAKVRCLQSKDAASLIRAQQGGEAAARLLTYESQVGYLCDLLLHYARMQTFRPRRLPQAVPAASLLLVAVPAPPRKLEEAARRAKLRSPVQASPVGLGPAQAEGSSSPGDGGRASPPLAGPLASARPIDLLREATGGRWPPIAGDRLLAFVDLSRADCILAAVAAWCLLGLLCSWRFKVVRSKHVGEDGVL